MDLSTQHDQPRPVPIVGIGASAGGLEAIEGFFRGMPADPDLACVIVTHLNPQRESLLHQIVARYTSLPVEVAADGVQVEANRVYVLPADALLSIVNGRLAISRPSAGRRERHPIDIFFSALALDRGEFAAGVVLSGGDGDGALGIKAIKERGGLTMAQVADGYGPQHPSMPDTAIATGLVDFALPAEAMGARLAAFARSLLVEAPGEVGPLGTPAAAAGLRQEICGILRNQVGHDFNGYKDKTFLRRVHRRMQVQQVDTLEAYVERLRQDPQEVGALFRDLLINVTNFFRDAEAFACLAELVIPRLFEGRGADATVRIWVPGCSTGEEVYSIAILVREHMDTLSARPLVQIFATDIDDHALAVARAGRYPEALLDSVSPERRTRFFESGGGSYLVAKDVRDLCVFSPHSVIRDPPFSRIDLVSCRNLLIYLGADTQAQVIPIFHYALQRGGYLFLGTSENVGQFGELFTPIEKKHRIFRSRENSHVARRLPLVLKGLRGQPVSGDQARTQPRSGATWRQAIESQVLERFSPPHVVVTRDGDVVHYSARTGKYLEAAAGVPTRQLLTLARKGLRFDLRSVMREAVEFNRTATCSGVVVEGDDGRLQTLTLIVDPLPHHGEEEALYLVLFADVGPTLSREEASDRAGANRDGATVQLEHELRDTRERLQSLIEEYETALEELKSSNEELVSVNEELQSTNEELEASKEELVSLNEELQTVNGELHAKLEALDRANGDLQNLFESTAVATIFLDCHLAIRSFTPAVTRVFNILPGDRGRPITDLSARLDLPGFVQDIAAVFATGQPLERSAGQAGQAAHYMVRLAPYRDLQQVIEGVVVTFIDVTSLTQAEAQQRVLVAELQHRTRNLLAIVQAIAHRTLGRGGSLESFTARLSALGRVQGLISHATDEQVDLAELVRLELQAHGAAEGRNVAIDGPPVALTVERVQTFALALHELATNAVKHGALRAGAPDSVGRLDIAWTVETIDGSRRLLLDWRESGVSIETGETPRGYGRELIERALTFTLKAQTRLEFGSDGVTCHIEMPLAMRPSEDASVTGAQQ
ncbi:CheR family methyltransferase [Lichenicoccus roseus]|uniref:CheR family methyltransferase n=1 Tax=Lichenicoccus roseus TaxID=2683649 RepID=UPI00197F5173|nr:CheR family methyltransferase [Lichenicoccus roseus]